MLMVDRISETCIEKGFVRCLVADTYPCDPRGSIPKRFFGWVRLISSRKIVSAGRFVQVPALGFSLLLPRNVSNMLRYAKCDNYYLQRNPGNNYA